VRRRAIAVMSIVTVAVACKDKAPAPSPTTATDRWVEIERAAEPLVAPGDASRLVAVIGTLASPPPATDEIADDAIEGLIAWSTAGGGLPWRGVYDIQGDRTRDLMKIHAVGKAAVARSDPPAIAAALYLGHRLRAEGTSILEATVGMSIALDASEHGAPTDDARRYAPTDAEARRTLATEALVGRTLTRDEPALRDPVRVYYQELVLAAPADRAALLAHVEKTTKRHASDAIDLIGGALATRLRGLYDEHDRYHRWLGGK
jgi:hypothetical protein